MKRAFTVGLLVVVGCFLAATVWMMGSMLAGGVAVVRSFDERCTEPSDVVFPRGSCAPPLRAEDFAAGRATTTLTVVRTDSGTRLIDYTTSPSSRHGQRVRATS